MPLKGCSNVVIRPCYNGRVLADIEQVAGEGLSAISIKQQSHRHCTFMTDSKSKEPVISCAKGFKGRNSFWNLHTPDLSKIKSLECATTASVTQLMEAHCVKNTGKPTYRKRMLRLLGELLSKKTKPSPHQHIVAQRSWSRNLCLLSSVYQEKENSWTGLMTLQTMSNNLHTSSSNKEKISSENDLNTNEMKTITSMNKCQSATGFVYMPLPLPTNMLSLKSDNVSTDTSNNLNPLNRDNNPSQAQCSFAPIEQSTQHLVIKNTNEAPLSHHISALSFKNLPTEQPHESKISMHLINTNKNKIYPKEFFVDNHSEMKVEYANVDSQCIQTNDLLTFQYGSMNESINMPSSDEIVQSIFEEMFKEMQEIEDFISSYISSFYVHEEEYENYPIINNENKLSSEVISYCFEKACNSSKLGCNSSQAKENCFFSSENPEINEKSCKVTDFMTDGSPLRPSSTLQVPLKDESFNGLIKKPISEMKNCTDNHNCRTASDKSFKHDVKENCSNNVEKCFIQDSLAGYCNWMNNDITSDISGNRAFLESNYSNSPIQLKTQVPLMSTNTHLIPTSFFENLWKEMTQNLDQNVAFSKLSTSELTKTHCCPVEVACPSYCQWVNRHSQNLLEEVQSIANSLDNFLVSGYLPYEDRATINNNSCSIIEIDDKNYQNDTSNTLTMPMHQEECYMCNEDIKFERSKDQHTILPVIEDLKMDAQHLASKAFCKLSNKNQDNVMDDEDLFNFRCEQLSRTLNIEDNLNTKYSKDLNQNVEDTSSIEKSYFRTHTNENCMIAHFIEKGLSETDLITKSHTTEKNINTENTLTSSQLDNSTSNTCGSRLLRISKNRNKISSSEENTNFIFSSPSIQLNLTNPLSNVNKK